MAILLATDLGPAEFRTWRDALARELPGETLLGASEARADPAAIETSIAAWNAAMGIVDARLARTGAYVAGATFTLADVVIGLSTHRFLLTPMQRARLPALEAYYARLRERPAFRRNAPDDVP